MSINIALPWSRPPLRSNDRRSWQAQHRAFQDALEQAAWAVKAARARPIVGAEVTLHWRPTNNRRQDADGMAPTLKAVLDAVVAEGVLRDDSWVCVPAATCRIHPPNGDPAAMWLSLDHVQNYEPGVSA